MWLVIFMSVTSLVQGSEVYDRSENRSRQIIKNIRRQLMRDNYDYSLEENKNIVTKGTKTTRIIKDIRKNFYISELKKKENKNNVSYDTSDHEAYKKSDLVSKKDRLHFIEEENSEPAKDKFKNKIIQSTARYKFLKMKHQYRRNNQPRLIQEENNDGVAIVNLDRGPFPDLRLPKTMRQYMQQRGGLITNEKELSPPPVNTSDPEAAAEDCGEEKEELRQHTRK